MEDSFENLVEFEYLIRKPKNFGNGKDQNHGTMANGEESMKWLNLRMLSEGRGGGAGICLVLKVLLTMKSPFFPLIQAFISSNRGDCHNTFTSFSFFSPQFD